MSLSLERERGLVEFLLGGLTPEERAQIEERVFSDPDLHEELQATSDDLIHAYLTGTLSAEDRERFETHFLASPRRRQRLEFLKGLLVAITRRSARQRTSAVSRRWALAAVLVLGSVATLIALLLRPSGPVVEQAALPPAPSSQTPGPTLRASAGPTPPTTRRAERPRRPPPGRKEPQRSQASAIRVVRVPKEATTQPLDVALTPRTQTVRVEVDVDGARHPSFDAVIRTSDGSAVWREEELVPESPGEPLVLTVPRAVLTADDYVLSVEGEVVRGAPAPRFVLKRALRIVRSR